ncbi:MAG: hypothetical protein QOG99_2117, partial [Frankiales bacterium]|nr:hypothetical protein [Frankiales bacterium]
IDAETRLELQDAAQQTRKELSDADRLEQQARERAEKERASADAAEQAAARARAEADRLADQNH